MVTPIFALSESKPPLIPVPFSTVLYDLGNSIISDSSISVEKKVKTSSAPSSLR